MAAITLDELTKIRPAYSNLSIHSRPENPSGQCVYRDYSFEAAAKSNIYHINQLKDDEIISIFKRITDEKFSDMSEKDLFDFVSVALQVRSPITNATVFGQPWHESQLCADYKTATPNISSKVSMVRTAVTTLIPSSENMETNEENSLQAAAISFVFAWMTRFAVKTPGSALTLQYGQLKDTFMKFYLRSSIVFEKFRPGTAWLFCLRNAFDAFVRVKNTLVLYVASAETCQRDEPRVFNLLRYLFFQHLEFMGMHVYVSIVNIMSKIALPPSLILTWLRMSGSEMAIDEAYAIMSKLDNGRKSERLWKYARLLDAGFFNRLQTSHSAELMATLAYIEIKLGISQETGYASPLHIFVIANNKHVRDIGKEKAEAFMDKILYARSYDVNVHGTREDDRTETAKRPAEGYLDDTPAARKKPLTESEPSITLPRSNCNIHT